jgi:transcriptional regulator with XRE-family HTH domain
MSDAIAKNSLTVALRICEASDMQSSQAAATKAIRLHLAARDKRQAWLAEQLGVSPFWLSRRMSGTKTFDVEDLDRIADVFGTTLDALLSSAKAVAS